MLDKMLYHILIRYDDATQGQKVYTINSTNITKTNNHLSS
jgi:hypothetical protein